jgi:phage tail sheath protein FI
MYGNYIQNSYLTYAVEGFFGNGGKRCYIGRIAPWDATTAYKKLGEITFKAVGPGKWGNRIGIRIENSSVDEQNEKPDGEKSFKLTVAYWKEPQDLEAAGNDEEKEKRRKKLIESVAYFESFDNLSENANSVDYFIKKLGDPKKNLSNLVVLEGEGRPPNTEEGFYFTALGDGDDTNTPLLAKDYRGKSKLSPEGVTGLTAFEEIDEISLISAPDAQFLDKNECKTVMNDILTQCETLKDRFAILDAPSNYKDIKTLKIDELVTPSKYGAIYYPWIIVYDPIAGGQKLIPPGGHIAGIYARSDNERGVHKAPANEYVKGAKDLEFNITKGEQDFLNPRGINVIRNFPGRGILVWGARTAIIDPLWKYINVRRLFIWVEESIEEGTQWVVFEPNNEKLWARVKATITQFLTGVWRDGALMGIKPEEAFFVKCDRSTMTQDDIDNGRLICIIGIAPTKPAEFVIFRITQWQGGSAATE